MDKRAILSGLAELESCGAKLWALDNFTQQTRRQKAGQVLEWGKVWTSKTVKACSATAVTCNWECSRHLSSTLSNPLYLYTHKYVMRMRIPRTVLQGFCKTLYVSTGCDQEFNPLSTVLPVL